MIKRLICLFKGHRYEKSYDLNPFQNYSPAYHTIDVFGMYKFYPSTPCGYISEGLHTDCETCGKTVYSGDMGLPEIKTEFI